ncbi:MAG TPA: SGNH/GDSL hydrolase family protein [Isosphaeraceae bacterium]|nr:SGNH/GDSL hydrolase family protein [Isosphaeraceae bacterium]
MRNLNSWRFWCLIGFFVLTAPALGDEPRTLRVLLLGDSTTIGSICRRVEPNNPHLEDVIRLRLAAEPDLPSVEVVNQGRDGEFIHGLLSSGRYDKDIAPLETPDYILIRYGLNDVVKREDFEENFPEDFSKLLGRLRQDFPRATLIPMTIIPYMSPERDETVNAIIRQVAESEHLPLLNVYDRYATELKQGPNMLNYRRYSLEKIPEPLRGLAQPFARDGQVIVMDNRLDAHFGDLPGWFADRHPNPAGYHVIGDETAKFLTPLIRKAKAPEVENAKPDRSRG